MAYSKNTWVTGDTITADKMNNIESGVKNNDTTMQLLTENFNNYKKTLIDTIYPVGSIYMSTSPTSPVDLFGAGTWESWGNGRVPVGVDASQTEFSSVEKTGGEKTHTLTVNEMPSHSHDGITVKNFEDTHRMAYANMAKPSNGDAAYWSLQNTTDISEMTAKTVSTGGGSAHNNLQPYITCYMWKRTA